LSSARPGIESDDTDDDFFTTNEIFFFSERRFFRLSSEEVELEDDDEEEEEGLRFLLLLALVASLWRQCPKRSEEKDFFFKTKGFLNAFSLRMKASNEVFA